ncbi:MAG TPA: hypothetical protein PKX27_11055 [Bacteroidales bacterium]|jgi:hypothetical protein|nr:hypothetical protein [Bacteroidales bacterium]HOX73432.1 hypothetical protein [Bacteroidales bacterium]HPM88514.1 hypothetical protein [Bacteroidales bacterium]HQM70250.1 hypothetical protein [Bacteroidales bacterium]
MFEKTIFNYQGLELRVADNANEGVMNILNRSVQGSEGGMRFSFQNIPARIAAYKDRIRFISLYKKNKITGTVGACFRISGQGDLMYPSTYIKYLAFHSVYQSDIKTGRRKKKLIEIRPEPLDSFKPKTLELFGKPHLLDLPDVFEKDRHIMYAFIESMNERAKNLVNQAGFEYIRSFLTVAFSRFNPKSDPRVSKLDPDKKPVMQELLQEFYRDYSLFTTDYAFYRDNYYVLKEGDEIIAGVSAIPTINKVYDIPGVWGWVMMKMLPYFPYFRRLFSPGEFHFLVFDALYCKKGKEPLLYTLLESACAAEGFHTGLMWLDDRSELYDKIRTEGRLGALNRMLNAKPGLVYTRFINLTEEEKERFYDAPAYVSGFDFS